MKRCTLLCAAALLLLLLAAPPTLAAPTGACYLTPTPGAIANALTKASCLIINLAAGTYKEHDLSVDRTVVLQGASRATTIVDGQFLGRVFNVTNTAATVQFSGMTIRDGKAAPGDSGGAIFSLANLYVNNMIFLNNTALYGGAIEAAGAVNAIQRSTFKFNKADVQGGAINVSGPGATVDASIFESNQAGERGGAIDGANGVDVSRSTFKYNQAKTWGGAIHVSGDSLIEHGTFTQNSAGSGGAVMLSNTHLAVRFSTFTSNKANIFDGGAIAQTGGSLGVFLNTFTGNAAVRNGGAIYGVNSSWVALSHTTLNLNKADSGGAVHINTGNVTYTNSTFSANTATGTGGGIYANGGGMQKLSFVTLSGNRAPVGGSVYSASGGVSQVVLKNTILTAGSVGNCAGPAPDAFDSQGGNVVSDHSCDAWLDGTGDLDGTNPRLGLLANYGGPTKTHALLLGSPAINRAVDCKDVDGTVITADQRFLPRPKPVGGKCDAGAFEK